MSEERAFLGPGQPYNTSLTENLGYDQPPVIIIINIIGIIIITITIYQELKKQH